MPKLNVEAFERIRASETVLGWIKHGVPLPFKTTPPECELPNRVNNVKE